MDVFADDIFDRVMDGESKRIGGRIKTIRKARGLSQVELGEMVGLTGDRIHKYETGARTPKREVLKDIAQALGVNPLALIDGVVSDSSYVGCMYALFELEELGMRLERINGKVALSVDVENPLYRELERLYNERALVCEKIKNAESLEERNEIIEDYKNWKWNCWSIINDSDKETEKMLLRKKIKEFEESMAKLNEQLKEIENEE